MRGPYTFTVYADQPGSGFLAEPLAEGTHVGTLREAERKGHIAAGEWVEAGILDELYFTIQQANGSEVRAFLVYHDEKRGAGRNAATIVRERI